MITHPAHQTAGRNSLCVVVSHYNARPKTDLLKLLYQIKEQASRSVHLFTTKLIVVVNCAKDEKLSLPNDLGDITVVYRENTGFNIGSWDAGWRNHPQHTHYLFLQDECEIVNSNCFLSYWALLESNPGVLYGESLFFYYGWRRFRREYIDAYNSILRLSKEYGIDLGLNPNHLQTLALAASNEVMSAMDGFIYSSDKVDAIATEVLISRKALSKKISLRQFSWRPFEYVGHPQWSDIRTKSGSLKWSLSKALSLSFFGVAARLRR